jgi:oligopeptidase A
MTNPLLEQDGLPAFSRIKPEHVEPAIDVLLAENRSEIQRLLEQVDKPDWENFADPIDLLDDRLERVWAPVEHMNAVVDSEDLRAAYNACLPKLADYGTEMGQNKPLYLAYKMLANQSEALDGARQKALENALRDFSLSGVDLPQAQKARFREISSELSMVTSKFQENLLDATNTWSMLVTDKAQLSGLPESALELAQQTANQQGQKGWMLNLEFPSYFPVITYADNRELRREMYEAYSTRASDQGPNAGEFDNTRIMNQILALRHEQVLLLGFNNYAERSLAKKMARSTDEVMNFLLDLAKRTKPQAERELAELETFAREEYGMDKLQSWDMSYYSEKLRQHRYDISQEDLRPYFPDSKVISGMFEVIGRLFDVHIAQVTRPVDVWHPDVRFYEIRDAKGEIRGQFYFDLYARPHKRGGAWMAECISRLKNSLGDQVPVAFMTCNFTPPVGDKPALLTHSEVETLFHEFGHGLQHMLTRVDCPAVSGISGVAWDAVELPSQFMENWCWQKEALALFSGHYETGEPLPDELFQRMLAAKNFQSGMAMLRQLEFSLFDFRIYMEYDPEAGGRIYEILDEVRQQIAVIEPPPWNRFAHGFSHIFGGGYAAGYYSYKWAEVLSADAFSLFEEKGIFHKATGESFRTHILETGGSQDAMELFVAFRGREPDIDALLRHSGIG